MSPCSRPQASNSFFRTGPENSSPLRDNVDDQYFAGFRAVGVGQRLITGFHRVPASGIFFHLGGDTGGSCSLTGRDGWRSSGCGSGAGSGSGSTIGSGSANSRAVPAGTAHVSEQVLRAHHQWHPARFRFHVIVITVRFGGVAGDIAPLFQVTRETMRAPPFGSSGLYSSSSGDSLSSSAPMPEEIAMISCGLDACDGYRRPRYNNYQGTYGD